MPALSTPEARNLHREALALIEQAAVQQGESSASRGRPTGRKLGVPHPPTHRARVFNREIRTANFPQRFR
jgi:hypothetical protein